MNPSSPSRPKSFEGPGSRSLLGEAGPSQITPRNVEAASTAANPPAPPASTSPVRRVGGKPNVVSACGPCKRAHLACDDARPCKRCTNMGKEEQCEDVPHKKRGRPKVTRNPGDPYTRGRPSTAGSSTESTISRWRQSVPDTAYNPTPDSAQPPYFPYRESYIGTSQNYGVPSIPASRSFSPEEPRNVFTLFTTIDLRILRASPASSHHTGYHPSDFINRNLLDFITPSDRPLFSAEYSRLLSFPNLGISLSTSRETQTAVVHLSHRSAESIAEGMMDVYPNTNLRVVHVDHSLGTYNARLHFGGGCGGSLVRREMADKSYLVVSLLRVSENIVNRRTHPPLTPITPNYPASGSGGSDLPSFATLTSTVPLGQPYYPPRNPGSSQSNFAYSAPSHYGAGRLEPLHPQYERPVTATMEYDAVPRPLTGHLTQPSPERGYRGGDNNRYDESHGEREYSVKDGSRS